MDRTRIVFFRQDGVDYEYDAVLPDLQNERVQRFPYGTEPQVIATLPLDDESTVEVHGYAEHRTDQHVSVAWSDDNLQHCNCWVPAETVRRPADGEWHGRYVSR